MSKVTIEQKIMVVAKAFFDDGCDDDSYPFKDVSEQYDEMLKAYKEGSLHEEFIQNAYRNSREIGGQDE